MATVKTTQKDYFNAIIKALDGEDAGFTMDELIKFVEGRIALLDKKSANRKTKVNEEDETLKAIIADILTGSEPMTVTAIMQADSDAFADMSNQKVSALLRKMVADGTVERTKDKKTTLFSAVVAE